MIETADNIIQFVMAGICTVLALYRAAYHKSRAWSMLGLFSGVFFLGELYWLLFLLFYGHTPQYSFIPDVSWYSSYLFLLLLTIYLRDESDGNDAFPLKPDAGPVRIIQSIRPMLWLVPAFTGGMCIFYMMRGDYLSNIIAAALMTGIIWHALTGYISLKDESIKQNGNKAFYAVTLLFCATEYALWTASCFWMGDTIANPYFWFDTILSCTFILFIPALRKAVGR